MIVDKCFLYHLILCYYEIIQIQLNYFFMCIIYYMLLIILNLCLKVDYNKKINYYWTNC